MTDQTPSGEGPAHPSHDSQSAARSLALTVASALDEANCEDILVMDVRGISQISDYLIIASGVSDRQIQTAARKAKDAAAEAGERVFRDSHDPATTWFVLDFVEVVAHIFEPTTRAYYDLEMLWGDAPRVEWRRTSTRGSTEREDAARRRRDAQRR